eukprot:2953648-Karenia_brevis.AAC.1
MRLWPGAWDEDVKIVQVSQLQQATITTNVVIACQTIADRDKAKSWASARAASDVTIVRLGGDDLNDKVLIHGVKGAVSAPAEFTFIGGKPPKLFKLPSGFVDDPVGSAESKKVMLFYAVLRWPRNLLMELYLQKQPNNRNPYHIYYSLQTR